MILYFIPLRSKITILKNFRYKWLFLLCKFVILQCIPFDTGARRLANKHCCGHFLCP
nr:MAG TPA: hypothetical protein [Caudoviricetes sp.]